MKIHAKKPEDIMPEGTDTVIKYGIALRKGSILSLINNAEILESKQAAKVDKDQALVNIISLAPAVVASGMHQHVVWKNPAIQAIFEETVEKIENKTLNQ